MANTKNFSFFLKVKTAEGNIENCNETNTARGYRQSWFKTPEAAIKGMNNAIKIAKHCNHEIIEAYCFTRTGERF